MNKMFRSILAIALVVASVEGLFNRSRRQQQGRYTRHGASYVTICVKRNSRYIRRFARSSRVSTIQSRGGGYIGDQVPGLKEGYIFGDDCQPYLDQSKIPVVDPPPRVEYDCNSCPCGYYDGCNNCACGGGGLAACTLRFCETFEEPRCNECRSCDDDVYTCPDGTILSRNDDCEFPPCPLPPPPSSEFCCDPYERPSSIACFEGIECCPNTGEWSCSIGDGRTYVCGDITITGNYGEPCGCPEDLRECPDGSQVKRDPYNYCEFARCDGFPPLPPPEPKCCDAADEPGRFGNPICREGAACCPDGTWTCSIGDAKTYMCGGNLITSGFGEVCEDTAQCCDPLEQPGEFDNPICFEGAACCPDGTWSCSIGDGRSFPCGGEVITSGFGRACGLDCEICPGGFYDGCNTCGCDGDRAFPICTLRACGPGEFEPKRCNRDGPDQIACTQELSECPGGSVVGRDPNNNCEFFPCPSSDRFCTQEVQTCPNGAFVSRNPNRGCAFDPCPESCCDPDDRPGANGGPICADGVTCCEDCCTWTCGIGDGTFPCDSTCGNNGNGEINCDTCECGYNDGCNDCQCLPDGSVACTERFCVWEGIPSCLECGLPPPSTEFCTQDVAECEDGSVVRRDPNNECQFFPCPDATCCDPEERPGFGGNPFCTDGAVCCEDCCRWTCGIGDGTFPCEATCRNGGAEVVVEEISCDTCGCGYNDGCNDCKCFPDGSIACTRRYCVWEGTPSCHECETPQY